MSTEYLTKDAQGNLVRERPLSDYINEGAERDTRDEYLFGGAPSQGTEDGYVFRYNTGRGGVERCAGKRR